MEDRETLRDFPDEFESERLLIRSPQFGDGLAINEAIIESHAELIPWLPWAKEPPTVEESEAHCRRSRAKFLAREDLQLLLFLRGTERLVGSSGLHRINWKIPSFEIGYWCRSSELGKGYITEAVARITQFAFEDLAARRVFIRADVENEASWRIPERLGFALEGTIRNDDVGRDGEPRNTRQYSMTSLAELTF